MTIEEVIMKLSSIGVNSKVIDENTCRIIGGIIQDPTMDFDVYSDGFSLYKEEGKWILGRLGNGQFVITEEYDTLDRAVDKICEIYSQKLKK
jgi:hypothetical protein